MVVAVHAYTTTCSEMNEREGSCIVTCLLACYIGLAVYPDNDAVKTVHFDLHVEKFHCLRAGLAAFTCLRRSLRNPNFKA